MGNENKSNKRWRKKAAKEFHCSEDGIEQAIKEGRKLLHEMRAAGNPIYDCYKDMPVCEAGLILWFYAQNSLLRELMTKRMT
jgi:hypothetical protein